MNQLTAPKSLAETVELYYSDPKGFVLDMFPWGEHGLGKAEDEIEAWQLEFLEHIGEEVKARNFDGFTATDPIREAVASGHGIGKSTMIAFLCCWIMSTKPYSRGTITANTFAQLETKTWAAIRRWVKLCATASWFEIGAGFMRHKEHPEDWFCTPQTCAEENSEAFAGQHAARGTSFYLFDEDSLVPDKIHEVAERGGLSDGMPMFIVMGNMTRNTGEFYEICYGNKRHRWKSRSIDSRSCKRTNKQLIEEMVQDFGEDSDMVRTRVRGLPPRANEDQLISKALIDDACKNPKPEANEFPLIAGFDVTGGGSAWNVIRFRRGKDGNALPPIRIPGENRPEHRELLIARAADVLDNKQNPVAMMFVDSAFGAPIVERLKVLGYKNVMEVNFGGKSVDDHYKNRRAYMWGKMRDWLADGHIDKNDKKLQIDLAGPGYHLDLSGKLVLESKADMIDRGQPSPDDADALALTFAQPVAIDAPAPKAVVMPPMAYAPYG